MSAHALLRPRPAALPPWRRVAADAVVHERPERRPAARRDDRREPAPHRRALRRPRGARRPPPGLPRDLRASSGTQVDRAARALHGARRRARATASASGRRTATSGSSPSSPTARIGAILVTINPAYKAAELAYALEQGRREPARHGPRLPRRATTSRMLAEVRGAARALREAIVLEADWDALPRRAARASRRRGAGRARGAPAVRRPDQHPVHVGHHRLARRARRCRTTTSSTTRTSRAMRSATREHDRVCVPVPFYHCFGMVLGTLALRHRTARASSCPASRSTRRRARDGRGRALHRRCYGVPTMFIAELEHPGFDALRPLAACAPA